VFPFTYEGNTYTQCTEVNSDNGKAWCATEVDDAGKVILGKWDDCRADCKEELCSEDNLDYLTGKCVSNRTALEVVKSLQDQNAFAKLNEDFNERQEVAPRCPQVRTPADLPEFCRCAKGPIDRDLSGNLKGGCIKPFGGSFDNSEEIGYCFLENVQDPSEPSSNCFSDTTYSPADGRFYSSLACENEQN